MEQIILKYGLPKEIISTMRILYQNMEVVVPSPDTKTDFFNVVAGVLQEDTLASCLFILCTSNIDRSN